MSGPDEWVDTGITVVAGEAVTISANGQVYIGAVSLGQPNISDYQTPAGDPTTTTAAQTGFAGAFAAPGLVPWSLVGRIGSSGTPFEVGNSGSILAPSSGELYLSVNDNNFGDNSGSWHAFVSLNGEPFGHLQSCAAGCSSRVIPLFAQPGDYTSGQFPASPASLPFNPPPVNAPSNISAPSKNVTLTLYAPPSKVPTQAQDQTMTQTELPTPVWLRYSTSGPTEGDTFYVEVQINNRASHEIPTPVLNVGSSIAGTSANVVPSIKELRPGLSDVEYAVTAAWSPTQLPASAIENLNNLSTSGQLAGYASDVVNTLAAIKGLDLGNEGLLISVGTDLINAFQLVGGQFRASVNYNISLNTTNRFLEIVEPPPASILVTAQPQEIDAAGAYLTNALVDFATNTAGIVSGVTAGALASAATQDPIVGAAVGGLANDVVSQFLGSVSRDIVTGTCATNLCEMIKLSSMDWDAQVMSEQSHS